MSNWWDEYHEREAREKAEREKRALEYEADEAKRNLEDARHDVQKLRRQAGQMRSDYEDTLEALRDVNDLLVQANVALLAACEAFVAQADPEAWYGPHGASGALKLALAAIARAKGEQS